MCYRFVQWTVRCNIETYSSTSFIWNDKILAHDRCCIKMGKDCRLHVKTNGLCHLGRPAVLSGIPISCIHVAWWCIYSWAQYNVAPRDLRRVGTYVSWNLPGLGREILTHKSANIPFQCHHLVFPTIVSEGSSNLLVQLHFQHDGFGAVCISLIVLFWRRSLWFYLIVFWRLSMVSAEFGKLSDRL